MSENWISLIVAIFVIILVVAACAVDLETDYSGDDSAWNCILAIIILLCWLKGGK